MSWAFWRSNGSNAERAERAADGESDDPVVALHVRTRRRLIGAAALLLAAIIVLPLVLDSTPRAIPETVAIDIPDDKAPFTPKLAARGNAPAEAVVKKEAVPADDKAQAAPANAAAAPATASVETEAAAAPAAAAAVAPAPAPAAAPKAAEPAAKPQASTYALQVAAVSTEESARKLAAKLKASGYPVYTERVSTEKGERIRVRVGPYATREAAEKARVKLAKAGMNAKWVGG